MTSLVAKLVPDDLWEIVEPLLPLPPRPPYGGRARSIPDRNCFAAMVFMARASTPWRLLPAQELGCGSPATAWRRLDQWAKAGVFDRLHLELLDRLGLAGWTGRAPVWIRPACALNVGGSRWRKSGRSRQAGVEDPLGLRGARPAADRGDNGR